MWSCLSGNNPQMLDGPISMLFNKDLSSWTLTRVILAASFKNTSLFVRKECSIFLFRSISTKIRLFLLIFLYWCKENASFYTLFWYKTRHYSIQNSTLAMGKKWDFSATGSSPLEAGSLGNVLNTGLLLCLNLVHSLPASTETYSLCLAACYSISLGLFIWFLHLYCLPNPQMFLSQFLCIYYCIFVDGRKYWIFTIWPENITQLLYDPHKWKPRKS